MPAEKPLRADVDWKDSNPLAFAIYENDNQTLSMVREALAQGRVRLAFQPVVLAVEGWPVGFYEGLVRIFDQTGRPIPARAFMSAVEALEIGREIDCASLALGLRTLVQNPQIRLSVNMSARSIAYPKWSRILRHFIGQDPQLAERLILEMSETSAMHLPEIVTTFMREWRPKGLSFAMDDYGSGHISIPQLRAFDFDILKIDGNFTRNIHAHGEHHAITAALLAVARQFDRLCVAEAVENEEDARWLTALGVDMLQGYFFGAPTVLPPWSSKNRPVVA